MFLKLENAIWEIIRWENGANFWLSYRIMKSGAEKLTETLAQCDFRLWLLETFYAFYAMIENSSQNEWLWRARRAIMS